MKSLIPWRRRAATESGEAVEETAHVEETPIDITIPRQLIYKSFEGHPGSCPRCGGPLQQSHQAYLIATRRGRKITDSFCIGSDFGWFCTHCSTVVINPADVSKMLQYSLPHWDVGTEFTVVGVVDLDAVPEEKQHLPLGEDDNPIPLVEFTSIASETANDGTVQRTSRAGRRRTASARTKHRPRKKHQR